MSTVTLDEYISALDRHWEQNPPSSANDAAKDACTRWLVAGRPGDYQEAGKRAADAYIRSPLHTSTTSIAIARLPAPDLK